MSHTPTESPAPAPLTSVPVIWQTEEEIRTGVQKHRPPATTSEAGEAAQKHAATLSRLIDTLQGSDPRPTPDAVLELTAPEQSLIITALIETEARDEIAARDDWRDEDIKQHLIQNVNALAALRKKLRDYYITLIPRRQSGQ